MSEEVNPSRRRFLGAAALTVAAAGLGAIASASDRPELSALDHATAWLNSPPLTGRELQGKVALIEFWTYSCINWRRQLPYVRAWAEKYKNQGLVVIGVHSPEFSFEKNVDNVRWAAENMNVSYSIAIDNDHAIWRGFNNEYWPALYFIDAKGRLRHQVFGEGQYEQSERVIRQLLNEAGARVIGDDLVSIDALGAEAAADWSELGSEENYVGYARTANFASPGGVKADRAHVYAAAQPLKLNQWALAGDWTVAREAIVLNRPDGRVSYRFHARDLHFVMGPAATGTPVKFRVFIDDHPPGNAHGVDVDGEGNGLVVEPRMYQLIRQRAPVVDRQFEIQFLDSGVQGFSFTFG